MFLRVFRTDIITIIAWMYRKRFFNLDLGEERRKVDHLVFVPQALKSGFEYFGFCVLLQFDEFFFRNFCKPRFSSPHWSEQL